jgi:hypothetical protein
MTDDERRIISEYVKRVAGAAQPAAASASPWGGRTPSVAPAPQLPPVDREADAMITQLFQQYPEARYRITQTAFVQEHALVQAQNRIQELEWEVENASRQAQAANSRGFLGFGGSRPQAMPPRPMPQYPPGYDAQALQGRQGPGFLGTALMTAAGVAGGMVLGNMLMNSFSGGGTAHAAAAAATGAGAFGQEAVPTASAWTDPGAASGWGSPVSDTGGGGGFQQDAAGTYDNGGDDASGGYDDASGGGYDEEN